MIKLQDLSPEVYYNQSRDFQLIGRLYDLVLNSVKTNTDILKNSVISDNTDRQLTELAAMSLGFNAKHEYNVNQLMSVCSCFSEILRNKGTKKAIDLAVNAILNAEGVYQTDAELEYDLVEIEPSPKCLVKILIPSKMHDTVLLRDLLDYILPAGFGYRFIRSNTLDVTDGTSNLTAVDNVNSYKNWYNTNKIPAGYPDTFEARVARETAKSSTDATYSDINPTDITGTYVNAAVWRPTEVVVVQEPAQEPVQETIPTDQENTQNNQ